tara:strand:+ start:3474 stop:4070 length:597 start_codon:yes stop_codon:yes gene_type:complete
MLTLYNENLLLTLRNFFKYEPQLDIIVSNQKKIAIYIFIKNRLKIIQKAFNLLKVNQQQLCQNSNESFKICIGKIENYECGYNRSCVGNIVSNSDNFLFFPEDIEHVFLKYFAKVNDIVIFIKKGNRAHSICPLFYEKLNKFNFMRINGIIDTDGHHIKFILRGQKHRFYNNKKRQPGNFITFCIKRKKNYFIPIKIR